MYVYDELAGGMTKVPVWTENIGMATVLHPYESGEWGLLQPKAKDE